MSTSTELLLASSPATYTDDVSGSSRAWPAPQRSVSGDSHRRTHSSQVPAPRWSCGYIELKSQQSWPPNCTEAHK